MGWRLDDVGRRLAWSDLRALIEQRAYDSAISRKITPTWWRQDPQVQMLAGMFDALRVANWQRAGFQEGAEPRPVFADVDEREAQLRRPAKTARQVRDELAAVRARRRAS